MEADSEWADHMWRGDCEQDESCPLSDSIPMTLCAVVEKGWVMEHHMSPLSDAIP